MIPCLVLGDSIAVGVGIARPECTTHAKSGITSEAFVQTMLRPEDAQTVIVSLGANDDGTIRTADNLRELRRTVSARTVIWLLPGLKEPQRVLIRQVAAGFGDKLIDTRPEAGPDHLHPTGMGYRAIADQTQRIAPAIDLGIATPASAPAARVTPVSVAAAPMILPMRASSLNGRECAKWDGRWVCHLMPITVGSLTRIDPARDHRVFATP